LVYLAYKVTDEGRGFGRGFCKLLRKGEIEVRRHGERGDASASFIRRDGRLLLALEGDGVSLTVLGGVKIFV
jgi:hypothetical protein